MKKEVCNKKIGVVVVIFVLAIASVFLISKGSYATEGEVTSVVTDSIVLECSNVSPTPSEVVTCTISGKNFITQVSSFSTRIILDENLTLESVNKSDVWEGSGENGILDLYTDINKTGDFEIATFTIKASELNTGLDSVITLQNTVISDENFDEYTVEDVSLNIRIKSSIDTLSSLTVSGTTFDFDENTTNYNLTVDLSETTIEAIATNSYATISGDVGKKNLNYGENTFMITVTSESGTQKVYTLIITRPEILSFGSDILIDSENKYLVFMEDELSVTNLLSKIQTTGELKVTNMTDVEVTDTQVVATGYNLTVKLSTETYEYTIVIFGDVTGDGKVSVTDVSKLFQYYRENITMEDVFVFAGDVKTDDEVRLTDVSKLFQYVRGTITSLE